MAVYCANSLIANPNIPLRAHRWKANTGAIKHKSGFNVEHHLLLECLNLTAEHKPQLDEWSPQQSKDGKKCSCCSNGSGVTRGAAAPVSELVLAALAQ